MDAKTKGAGCPAGMFAQLGPAESAGSAQENVFATDNAFRHEGEEKRMKRKKAATKQIQTNKYFDDGGSDLAHTRGYQHAGEI